MPGVNKKSNSRFIIGIILVVVGALWSLSELGVNIPFDKILAPFEWIFSKLGRIIFSWPMVLIIAGLLLVSGKNSGGWILVALGGFFLIPRIFAIPQFSFALLFPLAVLLIGIFLITRK